MKKFTIIITLLMTVLVVGAQTAYSTQEEKEQAFLAGCDDFISKPISEEILYSTLYKYLI